MSTDPIRVYGAGLAGCEAAWQLAEAGCAVELVDMKPGRMTPAHHSPLFAELVCSNSLRSNRPENAAGLLKEELRKLNSLLIRAADQSAVPAGAALAVDRDAFSATVQANLEAHPNIHIRSGELEHMPDVGPAVFATGPLTSEHLFHAYEEFFGSERLSFFDAAAPIVYADSIDTNIAFAQSRYDKGEADYLNCPFTKAQYEAFLAALLEAETVEMKDFDRDIRQVFEACMPVEVMARRGPDAIRYGPLRPVGLRNPADGKRPYAVVQLRQDNAARSLYNIVGFQTRLKFPEQKRVFRMIPGLENAEFARYGVMHRNSFINAPTVLNPDLSAKKQAEFFFAGQLIGWEGYVPAIASGLLAGLNLARRSMGRGTLVFPSETMLGALQTYLTAADPDNYQPMNANFGLLPEPLDPVAKKQRKSWLLDRARVRFDEFTGNISGKLL